TMDAQIPGARREMAMLADLVGAVRLPAGAHRRTAGTDVVTDLLILRRREVGQPPADDLWETVTPISLDGQAAKINAYFDHHPEHVLGTLSIRQGMYGRPTVTVDGDLDRLETDLADVLDQITFAAGRSCAVRAAVVGWQHRRHRHRIRHRRPRLRRTVGRAEVGGAGTARPAGIARRRAPAARTGGRDRG